MVGTTWIAVTVTALAGLAAAQPGAHIAGTTPSNILEPLQHRLAFAGPTGMTVSWNTFSPLKSPTVQYGLSPLALNMTAAGTSTTFPSSLTWNNHVTMMGLKPFTKYYYLVANTNCFNCSELPTYSFMTARPAGDMTPYTAAVVVDLGLMGPQGLTNTTGKGAGGALANGETNTIQSLYQNLDSYEFLMHPGDLAYADYWLKEETQLFLPNTTLLDNGTSTYENLMNQYYDQMQPITAQKAYMVGPGNHEASCDNGGVKDSIKNITYTVDVCTPGQRNFTGFRNHFRMPSNASGGLGNMWYSYDYGMVHYVQISTETDFGNGVQAPDESLLPGGEAAGPFGSYPNEQIDWLQKDLGAVDRSVTPWVVVLAHRPWYASMDAVNLCLTCQSTFEPIFNNHSVDLALFGHIHVYERSAPIKNNVTDPNELNNPSSPWYIVNGIAGHYDGKDTLNKKLVPGSRFAQDTVYGWSRLVIHNRTHLTHEFVASPNSTVMDSATLYKEH